MSSSQYTRSISGSVSTVSAMRKQASGASRSPASRNTTRERRSGSASTSFTSAAGSDEPPRRYVTRRVRPQPTTAATDNRDAPVRPRLLTQRLERRVDTARRAEGEHDAVDGHRVTGRLRQRTLVRELVRRGVVGLAPGAVRRDSRFVQSRLRRDLLHAVDVVLGLAQRLDARTRERTPLPATREIPLEQRTGS